MATQLKAVVGLNIVTDTGEVRYEPGDVVKVAHVEEWMVDEGIVSDGKARAPKPPPVESVDVVEPDGGALTAEGDGIVKTPIEVPLGETAVLDTTGESEA